MNVVDGLGQCLGTEKTHALLVAFVELLRVNGGPRVLTPERSRGALADDNAPRNLLKSRAEALLKGGYPALPSAPRPEVVVMGHSHQLDGTDAYVNIGFPGKGGPARRP